MAERSSDYAFSVVLFGLDGKAMVRYLKDGLNAKMDRLNVLQRWTKLSNID